MTSRLVATVLLAFAIGCVPDPKTDSCSGSEERLARCLSDDDAAVMDGDQDAADVPTPRDAEAGVQPRLDAGPEPRLDGALGLDTGLRDAATRPDAEPPNGTPPRVLALSGDLGAHDPTIIETTGSFTIFSTGRGLPVKRSGDLLSWADDGRVFSSNPAWVADRVPGATDLWAPDISFFGGKYHLYYSASTFGSRISCIGHAVATDLSVLDFVDMGPVICTKQSDDYNAIDPAFILDEGGTAWLSFGSFWSGIKLIKLDADGQRDGNELYSLASRDAIQAVEAPYLLQRGGYYYLFVSFDLCCRGSGSTYRIMVGRSPNITGPYVDADGTPMLGTGGGSKVVLGNQRWRGPGHNAVLTVGASQYLVYHAYDAEKGGTPTLRIAELFWSNGGWPVPVGP